jgi:hypothetical protein
MAWAAQVLKYLARYTHRVALSNARLVALADGRVMFRYRANADERRQKTMTLAADEFLRRFLASIGANPAGRYYFPWARYGTCVCGAGRPPVYNGSRLWAGC